MIPSMRSRVPARRVADITRDLDERRVEGLSSARRINHSTVTRPGGIRVVGDGSIESEAADGSATRLAAGAVEQRATPDAPWEPFKSGGGSDGLPPASSPEPLVIGALGALVVKWPAVGNPDLVSYAVHVGTDAEFVPSTATLAGSTAGTLMYARTTPATGTLSYDTDYFVRLVASDVDGSADPGPAVQGRLDRVGVDDIVTGAVTAEHLEAVMALVTTLQAGPLLEISSAEYAEDGVTPVGGIVVKDPANPTGTPLVRLHPGGCRFRGELVTDLLTVLQEASITSRLSLGTGAVGELANGVPNPSQGPAMNVGPQATSSWPAPPSGWVQRGITWSDDDGGIWYRLLWHAVDKRIAVQKVSESGVSTSFVNTGDGLQNVTTVSSICRYGQSSLVICARETFSSGIFWRVFRYNFAGTRQNASNFGPVEDTMGEPAVGNDASTGELVAIRARNSSVIEFYSINGANLVQQNAVVSVSRSSSAIPSGNVVMRAGAIAAFDLGSLKTWISAGAGNYYADFPGWSSQPVENVAGRADLSWSFDSSIANGGVAWKSSGTNSGRFHSTHADGLLTVWGAYKPSSDQSWTARYADRNGSLTTLASPASTITVPARRIVTVTLPAAPNGVTGADLWVGYAASGTASTVRLRPETIPANRAARLLQGKLTTGSTTLPASNTMGGVPAILRSQAQPGWAQHGNGKFEVARQPVDLVDVTNKAYVDGPAWTPMTITGGTNGATSIAANPAMYRYHNGALQLKGRIEKNSGSWATNTNNTIGSIAAPGVEKVVGIFGGAGVRPGRLVIFADGTLRYDNGHEGASTNVYFDSCPSIWL